MKKLLMFALMLGSAAVAVPAAEAKASSTAMTADPQIRVQIGGGNRRSRNRVIRTSTTTRIIGYGRNRFRETIRVTRYPNGRVTTQVIDRQRIRG